MPTNRRKRTRTRRRLAVSKTVWAILNDQPIPPDGNPWEELDLKYPHENSQDKSLHDYWSLCRNQILAQWIEKQPCTRPSCWWKYDDNHEDLLDFESEASYLKRHGYLTPGEERWLDKHPEALDPEYPDDED